MLQSYLSSLLMNKQKEKLHPLMWKRAAQGNSVVVVVEVVCVLYVCVQLFPGIL